MDAPGCGGSHQGVAPAAASRRAPSHGDAGPRTRRGGRCMRVLIVFGTTEGHTREICQFAARVLREAGHTATVEEVRDEGEGVQVAAYDAVLVAGSLHLGRYQPGLVRF